MTKSNMDNIKHNIGDKIVNEAMEIAPIIRTKATVTIVTVEEPTIVTTKKDS